MSKKKADHLHKYKKVEWGRKGQKIFRCMVPGCPHFIRTEMAENAMCACNRCGNLMILNKSKMKLTKPHCDTCTRSTKAKEVQVIDDYLENMT